MFKDRTEAGEKLAERLRDHTGRDDVIVLALPRGGVVLGQIIAQQLGLPLDIIVTRKVGHPLNPEYAICAVDEKGTLACTKRALRSVDVGWLKQEAVRQQAEAKRQSETYRRGRMPLTLTGKTVILVDDGIATGLTMWLSLALIAAQLPKRVIIAVPVSPAEAVLRLQQEVGEIIVLESPDNFRGAVGAHYEHFTPVSDEEVIRLLADG